MSLSLLLILSLPVSFYSLSLSHAFSSVHHLRSNFSHAFTPPVSHSHKPSSGPDPPPPPISVPPSASSPLLSTFLSLMLPSLSPQCFHFLSLPLPSLNLSLLPPPLVPHFPYPFPRTFSFLLQPFFLSSPFPFVSIIHIYLSLSVL